MWKLLEGLNGVAAVKWADWTLGRQLWLLSGEQSGRVRSGNTAGQGVSKDVAQGR